MTACTVREVTVDAHGWDEFVRRSTSPNEFLHSWQWGEFQRAAGKMIMRLEVLIGTRRCAVALLVPHTTRLGKSFILAPRGPIIDPKLDTKEQEAVWRALLRTIEKNRTADTMFLKVEPNIVPPKNVGLIEGTGMHPEQTLLLNLMPSVEDILASMHHKTRYNIRLSERHGVTVGFGTSDEDINEFLSLTKETAERQKIGVWPDAYYRTMVPSLGDAITIAVARLHTKPIAAAILIRYGSTTTYLHGASAGDFHEHMAPHLLQWQSICRAKEQGCAVYDFYGIAPDHEDEDHKWSGITRFKMGFGGQVHRYPGAFNLVYQRGWYLAYRIAKRAAGR